MEITKRQDIAALQKIVEQLSAARIVGDYGETGLGKFKLLLSQIPDILALLNIESKTRITILISLNERNLLGKLGHDIKHLPNFEHLNSATDSILNIELSNALELSVNEGSVLAEESLREEAIVYTYTPGNEYFLGRIDNIPTIPLPGCDSCFVIRTFRAVDEALRSYAESMAKMSTCKILATAWNEDERIFFKTAPEHILRDSLRQFIDNFLRGSIDVRVEQNVDESHPVDVKITWSNSNHMALIEVKWLGKSIAADRSTFTSTYSEVRAREGAKQLVDYLDANRRRAPEHITKGYLVTFDARRYRAGLTTTALKQKDGFYYQSKSIAFDPVYERHRTDFSEPIRIFLEPVCTLYP